MKSFPITDTIRHFDVSQIMINGGISCDICTSSYLRRYALRDEVYGCTKAQICKCSTIQ